jgi:hypothetical protein
MVTRTVAAIDSATLPAWPHHDVKTEELTIRSCLLGRHGKQPLTGPFGHAMVLWELLRHDRESVELITKQRTPPDNDAWKNDPAFSMLFAAPLSFIVSTPGFPDTPFLSLKAECQNKLIELFTPGQPAFEIGNIEMLDAMGVLERFRQLGTLAKEGRQHSKPGERFKQPAILKRENLNPWESVYDIMPTIRAHMGKEAVLKGFEQWVNDNPKLFPKIDTSIASQNWQDPRPILSDLAVLRLVRLHGYSGASKWTREHRPHKGIRALEDSDYESYFVEKKPKSEQPRPLYEKTRQYVAAITRVLAQIFKR